MQRFVHVLWKREYKGRGEVERGIFQNGRRLAWPYYVRPHLILKSIHARYLGTQALGSHCNVPRYLQYSRLQEAFSDKRAAPAFLQQSQP